MGLAAAAAALAGGRCGRWMGRGGRGGPIFFSRACAILEGVAAFALAGFHPELLRPELVVLPALPTLVALPVLAELPCRFMTLLRLPARTGSGGSASTSALVWPGLVDSGGLGAVGIGGDAGEPPPATDLGAVLLGGNGSTEADPGVAGDAGASFGAGAAAAAGAPPFKARIARGDLRLTGATGATLGGSILSIFSGLGARRKDAAERGCGLGGFLIVAVPTASVVLRTVGRGGLVAPPPRGGTIGPAPRCCSCTVSSWSFRLATALRSRLR
mmetsp:Transcript_23802/g.71019  ORF Transcript_23802/g.71019 Transcript_23802/m.71019 type:complete len:272 (+) Transcript_23802:2740-3555(+)